MGNYFRVKPPNCYKCAICGLFGDFKSDKMRKSDGNGYVEYGDWKNAWDEQAWSWEKTYVKQHFVRKKSKFVASDSVYSPSQTNNHFLTNDDEYDPCNNAVVRMQIINKCEAARAAMTECCNSIGYKYCDDLQEDCIVDTCVVAEGNMSSVDGIIQQLFTDPVAEECVDCAQCFDLNNYIPFNTYHPSIDPTINPTIYPTDYPTINPTSYPTRYPTFIPTFIPTLVPTLVPTDYTKSLTKGPTFIPTNMPIAFNEGEQKNERLNNDGDPNGEQSAKTKQKKRLSMWIGAIVVVLLVLSFGGYCIYKRHQARKMEFEDTVVNLSKYGTTNL